MDLGVVWGVCDTEVGFDVGLGVGLVVCVA